MIHIEITQDGKSIRSIDCNESEIRMGNRRACTGLIKEGETNISEIAPSRYIQEFIIIETTFDEVHGIRTDDRDDHIIISQIPTLSGEYHCKNTPQCNHYKKRYKDSVPHRE